MFAIVDIETCGSNFEFRKGRITEICILRHDGLSVVDKFTTLINPECNINPFFTKLTGITNDMVSGAPRFHEVAEKIIRMTEGCVFVAHNVGFDYNFIKEEFASLGYPFKRETLCTVRLSRKLMPGRISYSLGHLCASLNIEIFGRHRAEGDAVATAQLFDLLMQLKGQDPKYRNMGLVDLMTRKVDRIKQYILDKIPDECGVYYFYNKEGEVIYVGKSTNMYNRAMAHFSTEARKNRKMLNELMNADYVVTGSELVALLLESEEIKKHKPKYNRVRKNEEFTHCIEHYINDRGIHCFRILPFEECERPLLSFNTYTTARERLDSWIRDHELCLSCCGLVAEDAVCFNHQLHQCRGICAGEESVEEYNRRAARVLAENSFSGDDFVIFERGRNMQEQAVILVENSRYVGYGYIDQFEQVNSPDELKSYVKRANYFPDTDNLIKQYLRQGKRKVVKLPKQDLS